MRSIIITCHPLYAHYHGIEILRIIFMLTVPGQSIALENRNSRASAVLTPSLARIADKDVEVELRGLSQPLFKAGLNCWDLFIQLCQHGRTQYSRGLCFLELLS